ncbi:MAG: asparagine synthetase B family protein [bacterium]
MKPEQIAIALSLDRGFSWRHHVRDGAEAWAKGYAFHAGRYCDSAGLAALLGEAARQRPAADLAGVVRELNGCFAVVVRDGDTVFAAVDRLRSIPLFYTAEFGDTTDLSPTRIVFPNSGSARSAGGRFSLADDAFRLREQAGDTGLDPVSEAEFLRYGYVLGRETLSPSVKQLQPGEYLVAHPGGIEPGFYYLHTHGNYLDLPESRHFDELDAMFEGVFRRLLDSVRGRTIVVPLSGGYDSRYIAVMLRSLGCEKVICYTYGRADSYEVAMSRRVAEKLGYPWHYVEYDRDAWQEYLRSEEAAEYGAFAGNLASLPCLQESIAVRALRRGSTVPDDAVFVPGYCGATGFPVPAGGPAHAQSGGRLTPELVRYIFDENFRLANPIPKTAARRVSEHRAETLRDYSSGDGIDGVISANEAWFTAHRLTRFIVNAVRFYEFNGYEWRLPLWDSELTEHWYRVPESLRADRRLYEDYLFRRVFPPRGLDWRKPVKRRGRPAGLARRVLKTILPARALRAVRRGRPADDVNAFTEASRLLRDDLGPGRVIPEVTDVSVAYAVWFIQALKDAQSAGEVAPRRLGPRRSIRPPGGGE